MKIRGDRECTDCGARWSYYETGSVTCPECGSIHSVGVGDRQRHTASAVEFDLSPVRRSLEDGDSIREVAREAAEVCATYCRKQGFVHGGDLRPLTDEYLAAAELRRVGSELGRRMRHDDAEELYFLSLLRGADQGDRPDSADCPESLRAVRGLALAGAVDAYVHDLRLYLDDEFDGVTDPYRRLAGRITERRKRVEAVDGDVPVAEVDRLVGATRDLGRAVADDDETALATARERLPEPP